MSSGDLASQVETALRVNCCVASLYALYPDLLHSMVLPYPSEQCDRKEIIRHRKVLDDDEAYSILQIIWKESPFVTDELLSRVGLTRQMKDGSMTAWSLARKTATSMDDLTKANTRITSIVRAAEAYRLVDRDDTKLKNKPIVGTEHLHKFMLMLSENQRRIISELGPVLSPGNIGFDLPKQ